MLQVHQSSGPRGSRVVFQKTLLLKAFIIPSYFMLCFFNFFKKIRANRIS